MHTTLHRWFLQQKKFQRDYVSFSSALLRIKPWSYLFYRLKYFSWNTIFRLLVHVIEFYLLIHLFGKQYFITLFIFRAVGMVIQSGWWGALEILRTRLRYFKLEKNKSAISQEIMHWLVFAGLIGIILLMISLPYLVQTFHHAFFGQINLFDFYIFVILFQIVCQLLVRTIHSGSYAIRRVYRPFYTISGPPIIGLIALIFFWPLIGDFALPLSFFISSLFSLVWTYNYSIKMYKVMRYAVLPRVNIKAFANFLYHLPWFEFFLCIISSIVLHVEGVLLIILLPHHHDLNDIFLIFYLLAPLIRASFDWTRLFYFDLKRSQEKQFSQMLKLFNKNVFDASNLVALFCWAISTLLILLLYPENIILTWLFLLFFLIRSRGAYYQLIAFCEHRYFDVLLSGFFIIMTAIFLRFFYYTFNIAMLLLILASFLSWLYLKFFKTNEVRQISKPVLPEIFYNWFHYFKFAEAPAKIYSLSFIPNNLENFRKILQIKLSKKLSNSGKVSALDKNQFLYFTTHTFLEDQYQITKLGSGLIASHQEINTEIFESQILSASKKTNQLSLRDNFIHQFPEGIWIDFKNLKHYKLKDLMPTDAHSIFTQLKKFLNFPLEKQNANPFFVCASTEKGIIVSLAIVHKAYCDSLKFTEWQHAIHHQNCKALF